MKKRFLFACLCLSVLSAEAQHVGIGTNTPAYPLDLAGRMRIRNSSGTAGIYFDGTTLPARSFVGILNDDHAGIWGGGGAGWNLVMNLNNGYVGIGTSAPSGKLHVVSNSSAGAPQIKLEENALDYSRIGYYNSGTTKSWETAAFSDPVDANSAFNIYHSSAGNLLTVRGNGNVGIGTLSPAYKLDVTGRMRLQQSGSNTAGLWLDGTASPARSFIGTLNEDYAGIFGNGGAGWGLVMNVNNGNTGIGTSAPTAKLDINGSLRIRGTFPKKGSVLTSDDSNGNANWADPVAFKASGHNEDIMPTIPFNSWTRFYFLTITEYNLGFAYNGSNAAFTAPETGIYHFSAQLGFLTTAVASWIRLVKLSGGVTTTIAQGESNPGKLSDPEAIYTAVLSGDDCKVTTDTKLMAGDIVWVEVLYYNTNTYNYFPYSYHPDRTWFNGHLIARL